MRSVTSSSDSRSARPTIPKKPVVVPVKDGSAVRDGVAAAGHESALRGVAGRGGALATWMGPKTTVSPKIFTATNRMVPGRRGRTVSEGRTIPPGVSPGAPRRPGDDDARSAHRLCTRLVPACRALRTCANQPGSCESQETVGTTHAGSQGMHSVRTTRGPVARRTPPRTP